MARDLFHYQVKRALIKEGWNITADPYRMEVDEVLYEIDLGAEPIIAAEKENEKIAIEIKSFAGASTISEFHKAVGQFVDYSVALEFFDPNRVLYLAVPETTYDNFFLKPVIQRTIEKIDCKIIVYHPQNETIVKWIK